MARLLFLGVYGAIAAGQCRLLKRWIRKKLPFVKDVFSFFGMARPLKPRTEVGRRLIEAREEAGIDRTELADKLGISANTLGTYERGIAEPNLSLLAQYCEAIDLNLSWLATGKGEMFTGDTANRSRSLANPELLERLSDRVSAVFRELGQKPPWRRVTRESANMYNDLAKAVPDLTDREMIEAELPRLELQLKRRLQLAAKEPGSGKHSAL